MTAVPSSRVDWPISISTTMIGTEITPLTMALPTSRRIGSMSNTLSTVPMPVAATMMREKPRASRKPFERPAFQPNSSLVA